MLEGARARYVYFLPSQEADMLTTDALYRVGKDPEKLAKLREAEELVWDTDVPSFVRKCFGGRSNGNWDPEVNRWWGPRVLQYFYASKGSNDRTALANQMIEEFFERFPDTHPDFIRFVSADAEKAYLVKIRNFIQSKCNIMTSKAQVVATNGASGITPDQLESTLARLYRGPPVARVHDFWANHPSMKDQLEKDFEEWYKERVKEVGVDEAKRLRVSDQQAWRTARFRALKQVEQEEWEERSRVPRQETGDQAMWVIEALPIMYCFIDWFAARSGCPVIFATGALSLTRPGYAEVYRLVP